ncbi:MAG: hypothetical protein NPIRA04_13810 [Nitrospirales bacterium]|nr:MAG: hypothetical protein NPIRA04_13810 [Nitrospirales bacterium]
MKKLIYLLILFPVVVYAQSQQGMPPQMNMEQMQRNLGQMDMEQLQKAAACMENLDLSMMDGLEKEWKQMEAEIGSLCQSGKRDEAQNRAMKYAREMMSRPEMRKMQECSKLAAGMMPKMPYEKIEEMGKNQHVCDDY